MDSVLLRRKDLSSASGFFSPWRPLGFGVRSPVDLMLWTLNGIRRKWRRMRASIESHSLKPAKYLTTIFLPLYEIRTILRKKSHIIFGMSKGGKYLVVSYTERGERIRLISAREMTSRERQAYEQ